MKKVIIAILILISILTGVYIFFRILENSNYKKKGNSVIEKVEQYKRQHNKLPEKLKELNIETGMGEGPYYE